MHLRKVLAGNLHRVREVSHKEACNIDHIASNEGIFVIILSQSDWL